ncbi:MAG TPA: heme ABC transporter ATP-binding protein [Firmicutes bacterium]|nr:heme ABC transporter ATP-binding protein [Bacillota bacterium]
MDLKIQDVTFAYGEHAVLDGTTFYVPQGSFLGIIGPNGGGKTTLLKLLSRLLQPQGGCILLGGQPLAAFTRKSLARNLAVVAQDTTASYQFSVEDVVLMGRAPYLGRFQSESLADYEIVHHALAVTGCTHLRERPVTELSGGERQRVMIARALAQQPKVLLLDEPTAHLDIGYQQEILDLLKHLSTSEGLTVVAVLHDLNLAAYFCQELVLVHNGRIHACGHPARVLTPEHLEEVYGIRVLVTPHPVFGTPQVSLLPGTRSRQRKKTPPVHIIAGGGSGGGLMRDLTEAGYTVTTGVLNVGDSDWEAARALAVAVITEAPFSGISAERHREHLALLEQAGAVVLAEIPLGHGNLLNIEAALAAAEAGKPVYILEERGEAERDFTGGNGTRLLNAVKAKGTVVREKAGLYRALQETLGGLLNKAADEAGAPVDK